MAKQSIKAGATSVSINVFIQNSTSTTGTGLTGLVYNSSGLTAYYSFSGANAGSAQITLATLATTGTAWASGGFIEIDNSKMKGWYRLDLPNAVVAASSGREVSLHLQGAANMVDCPIDIELTGWDNQNATNGGMSALPATSCTTNASLLTSGTGTDQLSVSSGQVSLLLTQALAAARALDSVADTSLHLNDALHCAIAAYAGQWQISGTSWTCQTPHTATTLRTFTLDSSSAPTQRS